MIKNININGQIFPIPEVDNQESIIEAVLQANGVNRSEMEERIEDSTLILQSPVGTKS